MSIVSPVLTVFVQFKCQMGASSFMCIYIVVIYILVLRCHIYIRDVSRTLGSGSCFSVILIAKKIATVKFACLGDVDYPEI